MTGSIRQANPAAAKAGDIASEYATHSIPDKLQVFTAALFLLCCTQLIAVMFLSHADRDVLCF